MLKPLGPYGVGYKDVHLINTGICPDVFYKKNLNESDFSNDNGLYCHEIAIRVYYPSHIQSEPTDKYYAPYLRARQKWLERDHHLSDQDKAKLSSLGEEMDFSHMGLVGHSRGAMSMVNMLKEDRDFKDIKAIILLDPGNLLKEKNYPLPQFDRPTLTMGSSQFKIDLQGSILLSKDSFEVTLKPSKGEDTFSSHLNFSDDSTLQYHPAYQIPNIGYTDVGKGDGFQIAKTINDYFLAFLV